MSEDTSAKATDVVHAALHAIHSLGGKLCARKDSLHALAATGSASLLEKSSVPMPETRPVPLVKLNLPATRSSAPVQPTSAARQDSAKAAKLEALRGPILACTKCPHLVSSRTQVVFGVGSPDAELMFVGEAPGADEDLVGEPFVGKAGQLLTKVIEAMGFRRSDVFIANILKCRPNMPPGESGNRKPEPQEMATCIPYLVQQIEIIQPRVIVGLGATAIEGLLTRHKVAITRERGTWLEYQGIPLMPTFHPAYLLRNQLLSEKRRLWEDMLAVLEKLGRPITDKQRGFFLSALR